jgi:hypothetical protein
MAKKHSEQHPEPNAEAPAENLGTATDFGGEGAEQAEYVMENTEETRDVSTETVYERSEGAPEVVESTEGVLTHVAEAVREGASDASEAAAGFIPAIGAMVHKGVYSSFYALTYGVVFGSLVVGSLIPSNNAMGEGVRDGIEAAKRAFKARKEAAHAEEMPAEEGLTPA